MAEPEENKSSFVEKFGIEQAIVAILAAAGLFVVGRHSYLSFHILVELFSIVIASGIFILVWNTRRLIHNSYFLFLGIACIFAALFIVLHTLAYKGMPVFTGFDSNLPTQLWIVNRYILAIGFLAAPLLIDRKLPLKAVIFTFTAATILLIASIFYWKIFPVCYVEGRGLTTFKNISEYVIAMMFATGGFLLSVKEKKFDKFVLILLYFAAVLNVLAELSFTLYSDPYGVANFAGHVFVVAAYYFIYKAIIETALVRPYDLLFRDLRQYQNRLEEMVQARTAELQNTNKQLEQEKSRLRSLASELSLAEERQRREVAAGLHDHLGQLLALTKMKLGSMRISGAAPPEDINTLSDFVEQSIEYTRTLTFELSPPVLYNFGLTAAVEWLAEQFEKRLNIKTFVTDDGKDKPLANDVRVVCFQAIRELLHNIAKHAKASQVNISIGRNGDNIRVSVEDDGAGFEPAKISAGKGGFGLFNIRERLEHIGGRLQIDSKVGQGSRMIIIAPLEADNSEMGSAGQS